jgi:solute carrier family 25 phosphate transporter 23/24/25/41
LVFIRTCVAPLEKLKLEYIVRCEKRNIFELIQSIATSQGLRRFWKGNLLNILRTAPFKSVNFSAYNTYRKNYLDSLGMRKLPILRGLLLVLVLLLLPGVTATNICLPLDTVCGNFNSET